MNSSPVPPEVTIPAWWDPKNRKAVLNPSTIVPGILYVDGESLAFTTPAGIVFSCPLEEAPQLTGFASSCTLAFRITRGETTYRLYMLPSKGAPRLSKDHLEGIENALCAASITGDLIGHSLAQAAGILGAAGDIIDAYSSAKELLAAKKNFKLLRARIADAQRPRPPL